MDVALGGMPRILPPPPPADETLRRDLAASIQGPLFVADLLLQRGIRDKEGARAFFLPEPAPASGPLLGMEKAVALLREARERGECVAVHGDYDVDGVTGTALLYPGLAGLGFEAIWLLPNRFDGGYGLSRRSLDTLAERGARWVISVDTGVSAREEIAYANSRGLRVIVTDHHQAPETLPDAEVILNPNQRGCPYPNKGLSGCGVAWRLLEALTGPGDPDPARYLDLLALGSLADNVPVTGENRALLRAGLRRMTAPSSVGLRVLLQRVGIDPAALTTTDLLFKATPLLNAMGRMGSAEISLRLFLAQSEIEAHACVDRMEAENKKRRRLDQAITAEAVARVDGDPALRESPCLVLHSESWHEGVIGIVAARLVDRYRRPSFVLAADGEGLAKGSGRTIPGFHLHKALTGCRDLFEKWGGHAFACGFTLRVDRIPEFRAAMEETARTYLADGPQPAEVAPAVRVDLADINADSLLWLRRFEPFGPRNEAPVFYAEDVDLDGEPRTVGEKHLKFSVKRRGQIFDAIAFNLGHLAGWMREKENLARLAFYPEWNSFRGSKRIQLRVAAME
jgi:single-stranded-DNA-specific exonuclease